VYKLRSCDTEVEDEELLFLLYKFFNSALCKALIIIYYFLFLFLFHNDFDFHNKKKVFRELSCSLALHPYHALRAKIIKDRSFSKRSFLNFPFHVYIFMRPR